MEHFFLLLTPEMGRMVEVIKPHIPEENHKHIKSRELKTVFDQDGDPGVVFIPWEDEDEPPLDLLRDSVEGFLSLYDSWFLEGGERLRIVAYGEDEALYNESFKLNNFVTPNIFRSGQYPCKGNIFLVRAPDEHSYPFHNDNIPDVLNSLKVLSFAPLPKEGKLETAREEEKEGEKPAEVTPLRKP